MITFPEPYVQLDSFPGYYWNVETRQLYSIKSGVLTPMKIREPWTYYKNGHRMTTTHCYVVSIRGVRKYITLDYLLKLSSDVNQTVPVQSVKNI